MVNLVSPMSWGLKDCLLKVNSCDHVGVLKFHLFIATKTIKDNRRESVRTDSHLFFCPLGVKNAHLGQLNLHKKKKRTIFA